jgi:uncharacterized protein (TIGR02996 family)
VSDRLSLLRAILANPDDDVPRLVFADWLEEHGTTDADAARVEFIRLGCNLKPGSRITPPEVRWLDKNWQRLLPAVGRVPVAGEQLSPMRDGRRVRVRLMTIAGRQFRIRYHVDVSFHRGFAERVEFSQVEAYTRFRGAVADDEPLAILAPYEVPQPLREEDGDEDEADTVTLTPAQWREDVFNRLADFDSTTPTPGKQYRVRPGGPSVPLQEWEPHFRAKKALSDAMTALAREANGLTLTPPEPA